MKLKRSTKQEAVSQQSLTQQMKPSLWWLKLLPKQREAAQFILDRIDDSGGVALFAQQRSGKTYITCAVIERMKPQSTLVIAPLTAVDVVWRDALTTLDICLLETPEALRGASRGIYLTHFQGAIKNCRTLTRHTWDLVVIDESQGIKARNSAQSRMARKFRNARRRLALSGTPIDESPIDVWAQMRFVDHTVLGEDWSTFAEQYCYRGGFKNKKWIFDKDKTKHLLRKLHNHVYRLTTDFMGLKPALLNLVPVMMLGEQDRIYEQMNEHGIVRFGEDIATGPLAVTKLTKLIQITGGFVIDDEGKSHRVGFAKERKLRWLMSRLERPVVIFCQFLHELHAIAEGLRVNQQRVGVLWGHIKGQDRVKLIADFQAGKYDVLVAQMRTGSMSVSFTSSSSLVIYSTNHSFIDFEQMMFRLQGMTQKKQVNAYLLYCQNTVDEDKINAIQVKESTVYSVVSHFERS